MQIYFLTVRIAALFGHRKAKQLLSGQASSVSLLTTSDVEEKERLDSLAGCVWFHAASVGEFEQVRPIIEKLRKADPKKPILLTFFSPSGYEMRKNYDQADKVMYLPFATKKNAQLLLDRLKPSMAVFVKYEFWKPYLKELHKRHIPTYLISAIFRPGQLFFKPWGKWYLKVLTYYDRLYVQDEPSRELLSRYGIERVSVAGDTRFDRASEIAKRTKKIAEMEYFVTPKALEQSKPIIVAGSTWPPDERLLARYMEERDVKLVLVPHETDERHLQQIFQMFEGRYVRWSEATKHSLATSRVVVVDTMGMLSKLYKYATAAYVGGGFGVGIHNTVEAAVYGIPVLFGPNYGKFREAKGLIEAGAAVSVRDYKSFKDSMDAALANAETMGLAAKQYAESERGATEKIYNEIFRQDL
ncbi:MAG: 3-deoxy-D-manno-octulosonic acid transferase [Paludibacteraceae bacterium]|nr:3-deoxy-D-manno-octulosonic acid transferase [Paludibacteraceae bacterium]